VTASARSPAFSAPHRHARQDFHGREAFNCRPRYAEVYEPFHEGRGSSSTMPQKRNPIFVPLYPLDRRTVRQHVARCSKAAVADHERSTGPWEIEWISLPEIFLLTSGALARPSTCCPDSSRHRSHARNLDLTRGMIVSEAVMMGLAPHLGRQRRTTSSTTFAARSRRAGSRWSICWAECRYRPAPHRARTREDVRPRAYLGLAGEMV